MKRSENMSNRSTNPTTNSLRGYIHATRLSIIFTLLGLSFLVLGCVLHAHLDSNSATTPSGSQKGASVTLASRFLSLTTLEDMGESFSLGIGGTFITIGLVSFLFEEQSKRQILDDFTNSVRTALGEHQRILNSGIVACLSPDTKDTAIHTLLSGANEYIRILKTYIPELDTVKPALQQALQSKHVKVQILLLDPDSPAAKQRSRDIGRDDIAEQIRHSLKELHAFREERRFSDRIEIRTYHNLPSISLYEADSTCLLGWYWYGHCSYEAGAILKIANDRSPLSCAIRESFKSAWHYGSEYLSPIPDDGIVKVSAAEPLNWDPLLKAIPTEDLEHCELEKFMHGNKSPREASALRDAAERAMQSVRERGFAVIKRFPFGSIGTKQRKRVFLAFSYLCGEPVPHSANGVDYIGEIKPKDVDRKIPTYSEHSEEAELHTDSNYKRYPEQYMALFMEHAAECGGGCSSLLRSNDLIRRFKETPHGREHLEALARELPVMPPSKYSAEKLGRYRVIGANDEIRFRRDTIEEGLKASRGAGDVDSLNAVRAFASFMNSCPERYSVALQSGDILILDNRKVLHARTRFRDKERLMFRIRFNEPKTGTPWIGV